MSKFIGNFNIDPNSLANNVLLNVPCQTSVFIGAWVYMNSSGIATNAKADDYDTSNVIGIVEKKPSTTTCNIRFLGLTDANLDLSTIHGVLDVEKDYFLSDADEGEMVTNPNQPADPGDIVLKLGQAFNTTRFLVRVGDRFERT